MSLPRHILQITFLTFWITYTSAKIMCYFPDGSNASAEYPCPDPVSLSCCPRKAMCLTNGLCWDNRIFRGSCRDKSWTDPNCPKYCRQYIPSSGKVLAPCNNAGLYTCNYNCSDSNVTVPSGEIVLRDYQLSSVYSAFSASSSLSIFASIPSISTSTSSTFSSPVSTSSEFSTPSSTSTSPPLNVVLDGNCTTTSADHPPTKKSPRLAAVGAGVGVPLGLAWLATLVCFGRERRKTRLLEQEKSHLIGSARDYQQAKWNEDPQEQGKKSAWLKENRAPHEIAAEPVGSELQA